MCDESTLAADINSLISQITQAVDPEFRDEAALGEIKDELLRLQKATGLNDRGAADQQSSSSKARIPLFVPPLPSGILVTQQMQELQSKLSDPSLPRVGFVGMVRRQRAVSSSSVLCFDGWL